MTSQGDGHRVLSAIDVEYVAECAVSGELTDDTVKLAFVHAVDSLIE